MTRNILRGIFFAAVVLAAGYLTSAGAQTISGSIAGGAVPRGGSAKGSITMSIPEGLHVNSNRPSSQYAIPTSIKLSGPGVRVTSIVYPRGRNRHFQFSESPINVYEGRVVFGFTVRVPAGFRGDTVRVRANVRYQACTDEVCYPPKTKDVTLTARVR